MDENTIKRCWCGQELRPFNTEVGYHAIVPARADAPADTYAANRTDILRQELGEVRPGHDVISAAGRILGYGICRGKIDA